MRAFMLAVLLIGCGGDDPKKYTSYQECFDDKTEKESKTAVEAIVQCCLDHEIGGMQPPLCGNDEPECINYLTASVTQTDADITVKTQGCQAYVDAKAME